MNFSYTPEKLQNPPAEFWPGYFWIINSEVDEHKMLEQLHDMHDHGVRSVALFVCPTELQSTIFAGKFDKPYLTKSYFDLIKLLVDECEKLGMGFWLYDEGGFPGGAAGGRVFLSNPEEFSRKSIMYSESAIDADEEFKVSSKDLCTAISIDDKWNVYRPGQIIPPSGIDTKIRVYHIINSSLPNKGTFPASDPLNLKATQKFIELTYQRYKKHLASAIGKTISFTFTDEPQAGETFISREQDQHLKIAWTNDFAEEFIKRKGYDLIEHIPSLVTPCGLEDSDEIVQVRIDFYDVWSQLFVERFLHPIRDWCRENNMKFGGHFGGENQAVYNQVARFGHILRALRSMDIPGIDTIWRQIFPGKKQEPGFLDFDLLEAGSNQQFPKYASSIARQGNKPYTLTESFAIYGYGLTPAQMRYITDFQYIRGINLTVAQNYIYDPTGPYMGLMRPNFGPMNPLWKYMDIYHKYTARLGYLTSTGKPVCSTAVYYDIQSIWAGGKTRDNAILLHDQVSLELLESQCEFDYIDDDVLITSSFKDGCLNVGPMKYDTIIVPDTKWMNPKAVAALKKFSAQGGRLIIVEGNIKGLSCPTINISVDQISKYIQPVIELQKPCKDIRASVRDNKNCRLYMLTNEADQDKEITIKAESSLAYCLYDPELDKYYKIAKSDNDNKLDIRIEAWSSKIIYEGKKLPDIEMSELFQPTQSFIEIKDWHLRSVKHYWVDDVSPKIDDVPNAQLIKTKLGDWKNCLGEDFSGDVEYTSTFTCKEDMLSKKAHLCLGDVKYCCCVELNGELIGRKVWPEYNFEIPQGLLKTENTLKITVTNTLANSTSSEKVKQLWNEKKAPGWPAKAFYHNIAWKFETDSLQSGLYGPVKLFFR